MDFEELKEAYINGDIGLEEYLEQYNELIESESDATMEADPPEWINPMG